MSRYLFVTIDHYCDTLSRAANDNDRKWSCPSSVHNWHDRCVDLSAVRATVDLDSNSG